MDGRPAATVGAEDTCGEVDALVRGRMFRQSLTATRPVGRNYLRHVGRQGYFGTVPGPRRPAAARRNRWEGQMHGRNGSWAKGLLVVVAPSSAHFA